MIKTKSVLETKVTLMAAYNRIDSDVKSINEEILDLMEEYNLAIITTRYYVQALEELTKELHDIEMQKRTIDDVLHLM
ncbi:hypothetical protein [Lacticigenium naphthae]|uniref:hypothetical protein n=1 Tax=Lacticigenium naphthae TaxID=515351 RepID=UPI0004200CC4|nr:hypothetical protein [Lacticigenium naphthae]